VKPRVPQARKPQPQSAADEKKPQNQPKKPPPTKFKGEYKDKKPEPSKETPQQGTESKYA
jgi:hypothetical protein